MLERCPQGFWFLDDPDDFRELQGLLATGQGIVIDEITMSEYPPNQIKKLFDVQKTRRIKCRHFNGTKPYGCPMILSTNSGVEKFFPRLDDKNDKTGIFRRTLFQTVESDIRRIAPQLAEAAPENGGGEDGDWRAFLKMLCCKAALTTGRADSLRRASEELGIALISEVKEHAAELASNVGLKPLEQKRFLNALVHVKDSFEAARAQRADGITLPCEEEDVFDFGPMR